MEGVKCRKWNEITLWDPIWMGEKSAFFWSSENWGNARWQRLLKRENQARGVAKLPSFSKR